MKGETAMKNSHKLLLITFIGSFTLSSSLFAMEDGKEKVVQEGKEARHRRKLEQKVDAALGREEEEGNLTQEEVKDINRGYFYRMYSQDSNIPCCCMFLIFCGALRAGIMGVHHLVSQE
jgi:hypothetical protein